MKRVLIPVDGSAQSLEAVRCTLREGAAAISHIDLLNVQPLLNRHVSRWVPRGQADGWREERAAGALAQAKALVASSGIPWRAHVAAGPVAPTIANAARDLGSDEIVMASSRRGLLGRLLANSVSTRLLESSPVPVEVVPGRAAPMLDRLALPAGLGLIAMWFFAAE